MSPPTLYGGDTPGPAAGSRVPCTRCRRARRRTSGASRATAALLGIALLFGVFGAPRSGPLLSAGPADPADVEALRARIAQLEASLAARAAQVPAAAPAAGGAFRPISTQAAGDAGRSAKTGAGDAAVVQALLGRIDRREGRELADELRELLRAGEKSYPTLLDFVTALDANAERAGVLPGAYFMSFSVVHVAMLEEEPAARFAHYLLAATATQQKSFARSILFDDFAVFLRFHKGRFPDLERDFENAVLDRLRSGSGDEMPLMLLAAKTLGLRIDPTIFEKLVANAKDQSEIGPPLDALQAIDDPRAVASLLRILHVQRRFREAKARAILLTLARMKTPDAGQALSRFMSSKDAEAAGAAAIAYFSLPRSDSSLPLAIEALNSGADLETKRLLVIRLRNANRPLLDALKESIKTAPDRIEAAEVREIVLREGTLRKGAAGKAGATQPSKP